MIPMHRAVLALSCVTCLAVAVATPETPQTAPRWWKGNTHTHTLWSDGDALPEVVVAWYREQGYHFLSLTDHNVLQQGDTWFPVSERSGSRLGTAELEAAETQLGGSLPSRGEDPSREVRLGRLEELSARFAKPGAFLLVPGEEVTSAWRSPGADGRGHPIHVNALGLSAPLPPAKGSSVVDVLNQVLTRIEDHATEQGSPTVAHLNHPNFGWGVSWQDMAAMDPGRFFELYNGHRSTNDLGAEDRPGTERMWDLANVARIERDAPLLLAVATDDAHHYSGNPVAAPGRAWIQVRAAELETAALLRAMHAGDFYCSTGVVLEEVRFQDGRLEVRAQAREGETLEIAFHGARAASVEGEPQLRCLQTTAGARAVYEATPEDLFVRAVVTSSRPHPDPATEGEPQRAWTQPHLAR